MQLNALILADGQPRSSAFLRGIRKNRFTIVLDGAAEIARTQRWRPDLIAGDFDSVSRSTLIHFEKLGVPLLPTPDQNYTDLEKALAWCTLRDFEHITIAQALGGRIDHAFTNLSLLKRYYSPEREILLLDLNETIRFAKDETLTFKGKKGRSFAVLPFPKCRASSKGLEYELKDTALQLGLKESACNRARLDRVTIEIDGDALVVEETRVR